MAYNIHNGTKLTATGGLVANGIKFKPTTKANRAVEVIGALNRAPSWSLEVVNPRGMCSKLYLLAVDAWPVVRAAGSGKSRFVLQSKTRAVGLRSKNDGASSPLRTIRTVIHVDRPVYEGAGVWLYTTKQ